MAYSNFEYHQYYSVWSSLKKSFVERVLLITFGAMLFMGHNNFKYHQYYAMPDYSAMDLSTTSSDLDCKHDVFPSFHGADVRKGFLSHLLKEFGMKAIDTFVDNNIERGKSIGLGVLRSIRGSKIAIVVLSRNYASSTWCLDELAEILVCRKDKGQIVMVIFYEVDPTDVINNTGHFGSIFQRTCAGKRKKDIQRWRGALVKAATIAGYDSRNWDSEADIIEKIAADVSDKLNNSTNPSSE